MKLELFGFRCHEETEVEITENKLMLLSGTSGQGKSTILESLLFLLYDAVKKPFTFGKKKCKVILHYNNAQIVRQKNPNLVQVIVGKDVLENELAENWIVNEFGTYDQFMCACYIRQMEKHFIFVQSQAQIIDFIQSLAFDKEHITTWKEKISGKKKEFEEQITKYDGRIQQQEYLVQNDPVIEKLSRDEISSLQKKSLSQRREQIQELDLLEKEKRFEKEKKLELIHKYQAKRNAVKRLDENLSTLTQYNMEELETDFNQIMDKLRVPVSSLKQELAQVRQDWNKLKKSIGPNTKVEQKLPALLQEKEVMVKIQSLLDSINFTKDFTELESFVKKLQSEAYQLEERRKLLEVSLQSLYWTKINEFDCPVCKTHLFFTNEKILTELEKPEQLEIPIPDATEKELGIVTNKIEILEPRVKMVEEVFAQIEELNKTIKVTPDLDKKIELYTKFLELTRRKSELETKAENDQSMDVEQVQELEQKRQEIQRKMKVQHQYDVLRQQYENEKEELAGMERVKDEQIHDVEKEIQSIQMKKKKANDELSLLEKVLSHNKETEVLNQLYLEQRKWSQKLDACNFLKQKTLEAESLYLEEVIEQINLEMSHYLEYLFDKNPMTLRFKMVKEIKSKKETKPSFDMEIFYKNEQYDSISQLSGGESIKISLAILLTFNKILNSKFILLDESLNPLDSESKLKVLDLLKSTGKTCIVISHDEINGVFDKVLNL